jgi:DNA-binding NtrC family response regulator
LFPASASTPTAPAVLTTAAFPINGTVLVVDDEAPVREVISDILASEGMRVLLASNGLEGIHQYEEHQADIDLVLLDMKMPVMNGEQAFYALRAINPTLKIILSSGYLDVDATMHLAGQRFTTFLQKPYDLQKLLVTIQAMVKSAG